MQNRRFAMLAKKFVVLVADTENGRSEFAIQYELPRNQSFFLVLDRDGNKLVQYGDKQIEFVDELIKKIETVGKNYRTSQALFLQYLLTWIDKDNADLKEIAHLVSELENPRFAVRQAATNSLEALGEPAYQFLKDHQPENTETHRRVREIVTGLESIHSVIVRDGLEHNVHYLAEQAIGNAKVLKYLQGILNENIQAGEVQEWWKENGHNYRWNSTDKQFVKLSVPEPTIVSPKEEQDKPLVGQWQVEFKDGSQRTYEIDEANQVAVQSDSPQWKSNGQVKLVESEIILTYESDRAERWTRIGEKVIVEHWSPASKSPRSQPVIGIGEKLDVR